jgi:hypothetical protein
MEIEIDLSENWWTTLIPIGIVILVVLAAIGAAVTPAEGGILTPYEWQLRKAEKEYQQELAELRESTEELAALLNRSPDPVRGGMIADRIQSTAMNGQPVLELQRQAVSSAAEIVKLWAMGGATREDAEIAVNDAINALRTVSE